MNKQSLVLKLALVTLLSHAAFANDQMSCLNRFLEEIAKSPRSAARAARVTRLMKELGTRRELTAGEGIRPELRQAAIEGDREAQLKIISDPTNHFGTIEYVRSDGTRVVGTFNSFDKKADAFYYRRPDAFVNKIPLASISWESLAIRRRPVELNRVVATGEGIDPTVRERLRELTAEAHSQLVRPVSPEVAAKLRDKIQAIHSEILGNPENVGKEFEFINNDGQTRTLGTFFGWDKDTGRLTYKDPKGRKLQIPSNGIDIQSIGFRPHPPGYEPPLNIFHHPSERKIKAGEGIEPTKYSLLLELTQARFTSLNGASVSDRFEIEKKIDAVTDEILSDPKKEGAYFEYVGLRDGRLNVGKYLGLSKKWQTVTYQDLDGKTVVVPVKEINLGTLAFKQAPK